MPMLVPPTAEEIQALCACGQAEALLAFVQQQQQVGRPLIIADHKGALHAAVLGADTQNTQHLY